MNVIIALIPAGETTQREIVAVQNEIEVAVGKLRGTTDVVALKESAPHGAKGTLDFLGTFMVCATPEVIAGVFEVIKAVASRPAQPQIEVRLTAEETTLKFDPKSVSLVVRI